MIQADRGPSPPDSFSDKSDGLTSSQGGRYLWLK